MSVSNWNVGRRTAILALLLIHAVVTGAAGLELWSDTRPDVPDDALQLVAYRTVIRRDGEPADSVRRLQTRVSVESDGSIRQAVYDRAGEHLWDVIYRYHDSVIESIQAVRDAERWRINFYYRDDGRIRQESFVGPNDSLERTVIYEYGDETVEVISYRVDGSVAWRRTESVEDDSGQQRTTFYYPDGSRVKTIITTADEQGRPVAERHLDEIGYLYQMIEYQYQDGCLAVELVTDDSGRITRRTEWAYLADGLLHTRTAEYPADGLTERLETSYERDARGNWIRQERVTMAEYDDGRRIIADHEVLDRRITYR